VPDLAAFRAEFPVLESTAYLNAGTDGPVPRRAADAAAEAVSLEMRRGRAGRAHWEELGELRARLRAEVAALLGCHARELALTRSTTDGVNVVLAALGLGPGDEVVTSDEEHPGLLAPLAAGRARHGFELRVVPFPELAGAASARTRLVACSHVSWVSGRVVDAEALAAREALLLLDGAQGAGAVTTDVRALGCDFYACSGQKWLCGPDAIGYLYVRAELVEELAVPWPGYASLADPAEPLALPYHEGAERFDTGTVARSQLAWALAALEVLGGAGWPWVTERGPGLAARLAGALEGRGAEVAPRERSTLVSWRSDAAGAEVERLAREGFVVRDLPGRGLVRASVGAWSTDDELDALAALIR
jgi:L-cysteine/cystine lyase